MSNDIEIRTVDSENIDRLGFFCYKSKPKTDGYRRKLAWVKDRQQEGMRIKILFDGGRSVGFIEYIPGEYAWRAVDAPRHMVIHCPYIAASVQAVANAADQLGLTAEAIELRSSEMVRTRSPSAYGVFGVIYDGRLVSYHPIGTKDLLKRLET